MHLHAEQPEILQLLAALNDRFADMKVAGEDYHSKLEDSKAEFNKLITLLEPGQWLEKKLHFFSAGNYGKNSIEVSYKLDEHDKKFAPEFAGVKKAISAVEASEDPWCAAADIVGKLTELAERAALVQDYADQYRANLVTSKENFLAVVAMIKQYNAHATKFIFGCDELEESLSAPVLADSVEAVMEMIEDFNKRVRTRMNEVREGLQILVCLFVCLFLCFALDLSPFLDLDLDPPPHPPAHLSQTISPLAPQSS